MAAVDILEVAIPKANYQIIHGGHIERPQSGDRSDVYRIEIAGWFLGRTAPAVAAELVSHDGVVLCRVDLNLERPDIAVAFPQVEGAGTCGFRVATSTVHLKPEFELEVRGVLANEQRITLATIRGRRSSFVTESRTKLAPLLVTTLGRTGSSWLMLLLAQHPQIVACRPFEWEPRVASYWLSIFRTLSEPVSYLRMLNPDLSGENWWAGQGYPDREKRTAHQLAHLRNIDPQLNQWLGKSQVESLAHYAKERIESFYRQVAETQGRSAAAFFAEKHWPDKFIVPMMRELYPEARELFLVRDFRDVICSVLSFNKKLGYPSFGRELVDSDSEYVRQFRSQAATMLTEWKRRADRSHLVRYEDLILDPEQTMKPVLEYLGLDSGPELVAEMLRSASGTGADAQKGHQTSGGGPSSSLGRWKKDLDLPMQKLCDEQLTEFLVEFGYEV